MAGAQEGARINSRVRITPLFLIDGQSPLVASNPDAPARAQAAIGAALKRPSPVVLDPVLEPDPGGDPRRATLRVGLKPAPRAPRAARPLLVQVVLTEDGLSTAVRSGELAGKTYQAHQVARRFAFQAVRLTPGRETEPLQFPLALEPGWDPARCALAVLAQDEATGRIDPARQVAWPAPGRG